MRKPDLWLDINVSMLLPREGKIELEGYSTRYREGLDLVLRQVSATIQVLSSRN